MKSGTDLSEGCSTFTWAYKWLWVLPPSDLRRFCQVAVVFTLWTLSFLELVHHATSLLSLHEEVSPSMDVWQGCPLIVDPADSWSQDVVSQTARLAVRPTSATPMCCCYQAWCECGLWSPCQTGCPGLGLTAAVGGARTVHCRQTYRHTPHLYLLSDVAAASSCPISHPLYCHLICHFKRFN